MIELLIERYEQRKKLVYKFPSPYYLKPVIEYKEIAEKIKELKLLING